MNAPKIAFPDKLPDPPSGHLRKFRGSSEINLGWRNLFKMKSTVTRVNGCALWLCYVSASGLVFRDNVENSFLMQIYGIFVVFGIIPKVHPSGMSFSRNS
ncbi:hypothetical protein Y032_0002g840 [Ancylostoma ceylanicum]|nr:hypothetical protein Y032_0002g840 [Ancylostoma ceylanicum]